MIETDPEHRPPAPRGGAAETALHTVTMVIIRGDHRDYNSSGIICEIYEDAHRAAVGMRKNEDKFFIILSIESFIFSIKKKKKRILVMLRGRWRHDRSGNISAAGQIVMKCLYGPQRMILIDSSDFSSGGDTNRLMFAALTGNHRLDYVLILCRYQFNI